jgi:hypothetical protein
MDCGRELGHFKWILRFRKPFELDDKLYILGCGGKYVIRGFIDSTLIS